MAKLEGKICMVTGANSGIGKATAKGLAKKRATVVMVCRNSEYGEKTRQEIIEDTGNDKIDLLLCDLASQEQIHALATEFKSKYKRLDILINNAGVFLAERILTKEGTEMTFAVNFLAPFLLTHLLLDVLTKSAPSRIINVSSVYHKMGSIYLENLTLENQYGAFKAYAQTKLALILFTHELSKRLNGTGITVNCLHPGIISTRITRNLPKIMRWFGKVFLKNERKGAKTPVYLASSRKVAGMSGMYFVRKKAKKSSKTSYDEELAKQLWDISVKLVKLND